MDFHDTLLAVCGIFILYSPYTQSMANQNLNSGFNSAEDICWDFLEKIVSNETFDHRDYDPLVLQQMMQQFSKCSFLTNFACEDGSGYVPNQYFCDGTKHCQDGSDEPPAINFSRMIDGDMNYDDNVTICMRSEPPACILPHRLLRIKKIICLESYHLSDAFICENKAYSIHKSLFCNGGANCRDGSDEPLPRKGHSDYGDSITFCKGLGPFPSICILPPYLVRKKHMLCAESMTTQNLSRRLNSNENICWDVIEKIKTLVIPDDGDLYDSLFQEMTEHLSNCSFPYEFECEDGSGYVQYGYFCDGIKHCQDGSDEPQLRNGHLEYGENVTFCKGLGPEPRICILPSYLAPKKHFLCAKGDDCHPDQFRCKDGSRCLSYGLICDGVKHCRDYSDEIPTDYHYGERVCWPNRLVKNLYTNMLNTCKAPKRIICDGIYQCNEGVDECLCNSRTDFADNRCFRCLTAPSRVIPISKYCDNIIDCPDLSDECLCKFSQRPEICLKIELGNENMRLNCLTKSNSSEGIPISSICDGRRDCDSGIDEALCRSRSIDGLGSGNTFVQVVKRKFGVLFYDNDTFHGGRLTCSSTQNITFSESEKCDGVKNCPMFEDEINCNNRFYCTENPLPSIPSETVCDKVDDCLDRKDEKNCPHFHCEDLGNTKYLNPNQVCDGIQNCLEGLDECQPGCIDSAFSNEQSLIKDKAILGFVWIFGGAALIGCALVVLVTTREIISFKVHSPREPRSRKNAKINKALILSLSISDLLVAVYAFIICVKNVEFEGRYCLVDREWRSSVMCSVLGTILVVGSEQSVFTMVIITIQRFYTIMRPTLIPNVKIAWMGIALSWMISIGLGIIPTITSLEDYFVKNITIKNSPIFTAVGYDEVEHLTSWLSLIHNTSVLESRSGMTEWRKLRSLIGDLNPNFTVTYEYGYYSSHAVCLPTFFPDPKKDATWGFSFFLILINFLAFTFMLIAYAIMYRKASTSGNAIANASIQKQREAQNTRMQRKLTMIVATDFFCWMPVCIMTFLQLGGVFIPKDAYLPTGLLLIPINSALNPFLYSNLPDFIWEKSKPGRNLIRRTFSTLEFFIRLTSVTSARSEEENPAETGDGNIRTTPV